MLNRAQARWRQANRRGDLTAAAAALAPTLVLFAVFNIYPLFYSGYLSLTSGEGFSPVRAFVGLDNYRELFRSPKDIYQSPNLSSTPLFVNALQVTATYAAGVTLLSVLAGLIVAVLLNSGIRGKIVYRTIYFLPVITAPVAAAVVWRYLMSPGTGYVDIFLRDIGVQPPTPSWLRNPTWALRIVILLGTWKRLGFNIVIYLAGLQGIPTEYYDAAKVDGAGVVARFRHITVPLIAPITLLLAIMSVVEAFLLFDVVYVMTEGGPLGKTETVGLLLYDQAFRHFDLGMASAMGWMIFAIVFTATVILWRSFGLRERAL
jgi:multiple sugar transport system permease protein